MSYRTILAVILLSGFFPSAPVRADHFAIDLEVKADGARKTVKADRAALGVKAKEREALTAKAGATMTVKWTVTSTAKTGVVKDVLVHFFVVKEEKLGQASVPKLDKDVAAESALTMDFKPKDKATGELSFTIASPGIYLLRLETIGAASGADGHEHFAALDLVIK
jgi:hypothetical protein